MDHAPQGGRARALGIAAALRADREVLDDEFDALLSTLDRRQSASYWTPVEVAMEASRWLETTGASRVLDVGSGVGKFCTIGALATALRFEGIDRRTRLVAAARDLAATLGVAELTDFRVGDLDDVSLGGYDAFYLYNPFYEGYFSRSAWLDDAVDLSPQRAKADIERFEDALASAPVGVLVVTYHGFGGRIPDSFQLRHAARISGGSLLCWQKRRTDGSGRSYREGDW